MANTDLIQQPQADPSFLSLLVRFFLTATLARTATSGVIVAVVMLASEYGYQPESIGSFAFCLTVPHLFGPLLGKWLDDTDRPRLVISISALIFTISLFLFLWIFESTVSLASILLLLLIGCASPYLMGGISSQLKTLLEHHSSKLRRAQGFDVASYGIAATAGPFWLSYFSETYSIYIATAMLGLFSLVAIGLLATWPATKKVVTHERESYSIMQVVNVIFQSPALRQTLLLTSCISFGLASLNILTSYLISEWQHPIAMVGTLISLYGVGNLVGSTIKMLWPSRTASLVLVNRYALALIGIMFSLAFLMYFELANLVIFGAGLVALGVFNAFFFTATLASRSENAPSGGATQVFMWIAAMKIGSASFGALIAGQLVVVNPSFPFILVTSLGLIVFLTNKMKFEPNKRRSGHN